MAMGKSQPWLTCGHIVMSSTDGQAHTVRLCMPANDTACSQTHTCSQRHSLRAAALQRLSHTFCGSRGSQQGRARCGTASLTSRPEPARDHGPARLDDGADAELAGAAAEDVGGGRTEARRRHPQQPAQGAPEHSLPCLVTGSGPGDPAAEPVARALARCPRHACRGRPALQLRPRPCLHDTM